MMRKFQRFRRPTLEYEEPLSIVPPVGRNGGGGSAEAMCVPGFRYRRTARGDAPLFAHRKRRSR